MSNESRIAIAAIILTGLATGVFWGVGALTEKLTSKKTAEVAAVPTTQPAAETQPADEVATATTTQTATEQPVEKKTGPKWKLYAPFATVGAIVLIVLAILLRKKTKQAGELIGGAGAKISVYLDRWKGAAFGLYLILLIVGWRLFPNQWNWFWARGAFYCWTVLVGIGVLLALRPKRAVWVTGAALALLLGTYLLKEPYKEWQEEKARQEQVRLEQEAAPQAPKWKVVFLFPKRRGQSLHSATLVESTEDTKVFTYYDLPSKGKGSYGTIRIKKTDGDGRWEGEWLQPGSWGRLTLSSDEQRMHFTGRWFTVNDPDPEAQAGGGCQLIRQ